MKEISIYEYIDNKNITINKVFLDHDLDIKICYTKFNDVYLNPNIRF